MRHPAERLRATQGGGTLTVEPHERIELRERAISNWQRACDLVARAEEVVESSRTNRGRAIRLRSRAAHERLARRGVDRIVEAHVNGPYTTPLRGPLAVIAAGCGSRLDELEKALDRELVLERALDGPTAVGLAIVHQPDLTVVDDDLDVLDGLETGIGVQMYAPRARVILLTTDADLARTAATHGIWAVGKSTSPEYLQEIAVRLIA